MSYTSRHEEFAAWWDDDSKFEWLNTERQKYRNYCASARQFAQWAEILVIDAVNTQSLVVIQQAKLQLQDKFHDWRSFVPKNHRDKVGGRGGHYCIYQVYLAAYDSLRTVQMSLTPPLLILSDTSFRPEPRGIVIGEDVDFDSE